MSRADNLFETVGDVIGLFTSYGIIPTDAMVKISPPTDEMFSSSAAIIFPHV